MKKFYFIYILVFLITFITANAQKDMFVNIQSGGIQRSFIVHLASEHPVSRPVVFVYHGSGGTAAGIQNYTQFDKYADQYNFIVVYPQATKINGSYEWNAYVDDKPGDAALNAPDAPDDIQFFNDIILWLDDGYYINNKKIYATGLSNGAFMDYALSMLASKYIAAIAPVAGNLWADNNYLTTLLQSGNVKTMPVMHVHGTADNEVAYPDPDNKPDDYGEYPLFVAARACNALTYSNVVHIMDNVDKLVFCETPVEVSLIRIKGMGHDWTNGFYNTTQEIVKFFGLIPQSPNDVSEDEQNNNIQITTIADDLLSVNTREPANIIISDVLGRIVYKASLDAGNTDINTSVYSSGMYYITINSGSKLFKEKIMVGH